MECSQLDIVEKFGSMNVRIFGSQDDPLFNANDIIFNVLGYKHHSNCKPWQRIKKLPKYAFIYEGSQKDRSSKGHKSQYVLTERGLFELLCQSNQEIAEHFKDWVYDLLKNIRLGQLKIVKEQLQEAKKEIEELKAPKQASVYMFRHQDKLLCIGKDKSKLQNRPQQHLTERRKIIQNNQLIDIYLATIPESEIQISIQLCNDDEADQIEKELIEQQQPLCNQTYNKQEYTCQQCTKKYINRASFEKHLSIHSTSAI